MASEKVVKTVCTMCMKQACGINAHVKDGKVVRIEGIPEFPVSRGRLCVKGLASKDLLYDENRLKHPMKKENGKWIRISWDEALDTISQKLAEVKEKHGAGALAIVRGSIQEHEIGSYIKRFMNIYGTPNLGTTGDMCAHPRILVDRLTLGAVSFRSPDFRNTKCMMLWGVNPSNSNPFIWQDMMEVKKKGVKLIVIDPRFTDTASKADIYVQIRPGTDAALALGMLNVIIDEGLYEKDFVERWTVGFNKLVDRVRDYPPEKVEEITSVPADTIREVARTYATIKPACLEPGNALDAQTRSFQSLRAIAILRAITGNFDVPGGNVVYPHMPLIDISLKEKFPRELQPLGADKYKLFTDMFDFVPSGVMVETMTTGEPYQIRAMIVDFCNLMMTWPDSKRVEEGLRKLEFLVVMDFYMTETAKLADIVLPASMFLEKTGIFTSSGRSGLEPGKPAGFIMLKQKVVEPMGECWPDWKFWFELAKRMGYGEFFPWDDIEQAIEHRLTPTGITIEDLKKHPNGVFWGAPIRYRKYEDKGFGTPSGKIEIYCERLKSLGYDPLPDFEEPMESPVSQPELAQEFPYILTTGGKILTYTHSSYRGLSSLRKITPEAIAELHSKIAKELGINEGEYISIKTLRGGIKVKAQITESIHPRVISILHGWPQANANNLTDHKLRNPVMGTPELRALLCRVEKI